MAAANPLGYHAAMSRPQTRRADPEPRWPAMLALFAVGILHLALPEPLSLGPDWLLVLVVAVLLVPTVLARYRGHARTNQWLGYLSVGIVTLALVGALARLIAALPAHKETPRQLLGSAAVLWLSNVLVFASWYWRLDAGGPNARDARESHTEGAFLFPQMTISTTAPAETPKNWRPGFMDYLFLAFNTSTAFSPTDVPVLSRWAKGLMMIQSVVSLATIALLAARAVNVL